MRYRVKAAVFVLIGLLVGNFAPHVVGHALRLVGSFLR